MKTLLISLALLLSSTSFTMAQDFFLPVSTKSKAAKAAYYKADELGHNVHLKEANVEIDKALQEDPNFFMAYVLGIYYTSGEKKAELVDKALAIDDGKFTEAEKIVRQQLMKWKVDPKAKIGENMKELVAAYPKTPQAYEWASLHCAFTDKDADAALGYANKLAELRPKYAPNYNVLGYVYMQTQQMDQAKAAFEKYIANAPKEPNAYDSMGEFYMTIQDYAKSAEYYDKAVAMGFTDADARAEKARAMIK